MDELDAAEQLEFDPDVGPRAVVHALPLVVELAVVAIGGATGALARAGLEAAAPVRGWPWTTMGINVAGAGLLGVLLAVVAFRSVRAQGARLLLGTGLLGGFTTFSTFAVETIQLVRHHEGLEAAAYVGASVALSILAALAGLASGRAIRAAVERRTERLAALPR